MTHLQYLHRQSTQDGPMDDSLAEAILHVLRDDTAGATRTQINRHLGGHHRSAAISAGLLRLVALGLATWTEERTEGRTTERWRAL
jgi:hypothetical protein